MTEHVDYYYYDGKLRAAVANDSSWKAHSVRIGTVKLVNHDYPFR